MLAGVQSARGLNFRHTWSHWTVDVPNLPACSEEIMRRQKFSHARVGLVYHFLEIHLFTHSGHAEF